MKKLLITTMLLLPMATMAQDNTWEKANAVENVANSDAKYLAADAVPMVDGKVLFHTVINAPGKSAQQIYDILLDYMTKLTKEPNQFEQSRIAAQDPAKHEIIGSYQEWLVFKNKPLQLDRTRFFYQIVAECSDGKADISMNRLYYLYEEERDPQRMTAEEVISDEYGLTKNKKKLSRVFGKFRRKTIDRKDFLFGKFNSLLQ